MALHPIVVGLPAWVVALATTLEPNPDLRALGMSNSAHMLGICKAQANAWIRENVARDLHLFEFMSGKSETSGLVNKSSGRTQAFDKIVFGNHARISLESGSRPPALRSETEE